MVSERAGGNNDSYKEEGNSVKKYWTKHTQANRWEQQIDKDKKAFYSQVDFTAEIRSRRLGCLGQQQGWTPNVTKFSEGGTHIGGIPRKKWMKKVEDLKALGV
jgi:hypothetical protein